MTEDKDFIFVDWDENDPECPFNWPTRRKHIIAGVSITMTLLTAWCAVSFAWAVDGISADFHTSRLVGLLGITVFTLGFAIAPMLLAPISESYGRNPIYLVTYGLFVLMFIPQALSRNIYTLLITRAISGLLCSTGSTMVGGTLSDLYRPETRGGPMSVFSSVTLYGSAIGSIISAYVAADSRLGWRWIFWIQMIVNGIHYIVLVFVLKETRSSVLLSRRAKRLRQEHGDERYITRDDINRVSMMTMLRTSTTRPFTFLFLEPAVLAYATWVSFAWGVLYLFLESIPLVFTTVYSFTIPESSLGFIAMIIGTSIALAISPIQDSLFRPDRPESRLYASMVGSILFTLGLFIFGWCAYSNISWIGCMVGIALTSFGIFTIYLAVFNVLADTYGTYASSALAAQSFMRNIFASGFPLFGDQMYARLGIHWASSLLGFIGLFLTAVPFVLYIFGPRIRAASKYVVTAK